MMNVLPLFRTAGRSSPSPPTPTAQSSDRTNPADRAPRSISKLSLGGFRRSTSDCARSTQAATVFQDGSYLQVLSLKLSEGVSKALAQPTSPATATDALNGRRPIPTGRGREFGSLIAV
jgi:hypothetical protein